MNDARIVLVKPGDLLIFGNVGDVDLESWSALPNLKEMFDLKAVLAFEGDIDLAAIPNSDGA